MNPLENDEQKYRIITALTAIFLSAALISLIAIMFPAAELQSGEIHLADVLFDRSNELFPLTLQNMMWIMFFVGVGEVWIRFSRSNKEMSQLRINLLPEGEDIMLRAKDLVPIYRTLLEKKSDRFFFVQRLVQRVILQFQGSQSVNQSNTLMNSSLELMQHEIELKFNMLRYLVWLIPTLGFIGTVIGIALALSTAADMPDITAGNEIKLWMGLLTTKLGLAFNTTLVALLMSAILVFLLHLAQAREELALNGAGQYCMDNLINRLYEDKKE